MIYDLEPREFIYNRTGNLSTTTEVDEEIAAKFMRVSDLRRDIVIVDSGKEPETNTVSVNSDTLAWRTVAPLSELAKIVLKPKKSHQVEIVDNQYIISIHDQIIDDDIRKKPYQDREDYERKYLGRLKKEVKDATAEVLFAEKLGFSDQKVNYLSYSVITGFLSMDIALQYYLAASLYVAFTFGLTHPLTNIVQNKRFMDIKRLDEIGTRMFPGFFKPFMPPDVNYRPWNQIFYPVIPVDKWIIGRRFLAKHGEELM